MNESYLPGIGKKFWLDTEGEERLTVIHHNSGRYELYLFRKGDEFPTAALALTEYEARDVGSVLFGRFEQKIVETMDVTMKDLVIEWAKVDASSVLAGRTIQENEVRKKTGVSIVAIIRGEAGLPAPGPDEVVRPDDMLLLIGKTEQVGAFKKKML